MHKTRWKCCCRSCKRNCWIRKFGGFIYYWLHPNLFWGFFVSIFLLFFFCELRGLQAESAVKAAHQPLERMASYYWNFSMLVNAKRCGWSFLFPYHSAWDIPRHIAEKEREKGKPWCNCTSECETSDVQYNTYIVIDRFSISVYGGKRKLRSEESRGFLYNLFGFSVNITSFHRFARVL